MKPKEIFDSYLKKKSLRKTKERDVILELICGIKGHFDADSINALAAKKGEKLSRASVYRNISVLTDAGVITESIRKDGRAVYELNEDREHHDHLICLKCGRILEFTDNTIEKHQEMIAKKFGFVMQQHRLEIKGICSDCKRSKK